jgi:hypothetical protein
MLGKTIKEAYLIDAAIPSSHNHYSIITVAAPEIHIPKIITNMKWHLNAVYTVPLVLSTACITSPPQPPSKKNQTSA